MSDNTYPPAISLLRTQSRRVIIDYFMEQPTDEWVRKSDIVDGTGVSRETLRQNIGSSGSPGPLYNYGVVDVSDIDATMPRYKRAETPVIEFLSEYNGYPLGKLLVSQTTQKLTAFILERAERGKTYNQQAFKDALGLSSISFNNNIDVLIDSGLINADDSNHYTKYRVNEDSEVRDALYELNDAILTVFSERVPDEKLA